MTDVHMFATRQTRAGLLKAGKTYPVPDDVAAELVASGDAVTLNAPEPEMAVRSADEDAAVRSKRKSVKREVSDE